MIETKKIFDCSSLDTAPPQNFLKKEAHCLSSQETRKIERKTRKVVILGIFIVDQYVLDKYEGDLKRNLCIDTT